MKYLRARAEVLRGIRRFFEARGFLEVETPALVPSPGLDLHLDAFEVTGDAATVGAARYLTTSPEYQMKRLLALPPGSGGCSRIFQIGRAYRKAEIGARHNPEFTLLEWYRGHAGVEDVMRDTEQLVASITGGAVGLGDRRIATRAPFARLPLREAYARFAGVDEATMLDWASNDEERFFRVLVEQVEPAIEALDHAVFVTDYPASQASLARRRPDDARYAERFEAYVAGVELCNGFGELTDPVEQRARLEQDQATRRTRGLPVYPLDERFLEALGRMPPSGGNALGVDRLVALRCGTRDIREVMAFPVEAL